MYRKSRGRLLVLFAAVLVLVLAFAATAAAGGGLLRAVMTGGQEAPNPGDPDGIGAAAIWLGRGEVCWEIQVANIKLPASAAHIHIAPPGVPGPVVVPLSAPDAAGVAAGCRAAGQAVIDAIRMNPGNYYVNVHNSDYPAGAVRGQLSFRGD